MNKIFSYLALGDSYTIGENVSLFEGYPYQTVQMMRRSGKMFNAPEIIAKTGWTTADLAVHLESLVLNPHYDFISLLIGVNNQYRSLPSSQYTLELEKLIEICSKLTGKAGRVLVLSIPDWGATPFARGKDTATISKEIALFNNVNRVVSRKKEVRYVDITTGSHENISDLSYLSNDGLHPSPKAYARWAKLLVENMADELEK